MYGDKNFPLHNFPLSSLRFTHTVMKRDFSVTKYTFFAHTYLHMLNVYARDENRKRESKKRGTEEKKIN